MTIDCDSDDFILKGGLWNGHKLYDLYNEAQTPYDWHIKNSLILREDLGNFIQVNLLKLSI